MPHFCQKCYRCLGTAPSRSFCLPFGGLEGRIGHVRWTSYRIFSLKLALFGSVLLYLAVDLWAWHGPVWQFIHAAQAGRDTSQLVASVYGEDLTRRQLERHAAEQDWLRGQSTPQAAQHNRRLLELIRNEFIRITTRYNDRNLPLLREEAEAEVSGLASRAGSDERFGVWLASQGFSRKQFTDKVQTRLRAQAQLERAVAPLCTVSDEAVALHYELVKERLREPARRKVRHIFFSTVDADTAAAQRKAQEVMAALQQGADFAELAREHSEDARSAPAGGELGVVRDDTTNPLPELPLFGENAVREGDFVLAQSRWGWHILQAESVQPERIPSLDECRESLRTAIMSAQQELAIQAYFDTSYKEAKHKNRIRIYAQ